MPKELEAIMRRVQNSANYMPKTQLESVLTTELGPEWESRFKSFEMIPFAAASIGQVHFASLLDGTNVAVKVQYPGVSTSISSDLGNLKAILNLGNLLPKGLYLENTLRVASVELEQECDYEREAQSMVRFRDLVMKSALANNFQVPKVYSDLSSKRILVTEYVAGSSLDSAISETQPIRDMLGNALLKLCLSELFIFRFMQTDPNFSNFLYNSNTRKIILLDFGATRDFSENFSVDYMKLLLAGRAENADDIIRYSIKLGFLTGYESKEMTRAHINSLLALIEPFSNLNEPYDFSLSSQLTGRVRSEIPIMLRERLTPPPDEAYSLHRKLSGCFLLCGKLGSRIKCGEMLDKVAESTL